MFRIVLAIATLIAAIGACSLDRARDTSVEPTVPPADYAVYLAAIDSLVVPGRESRPLIVISATVSDGPGREGAIQAVRHDANIPEDVRADFAANNHQIFTIQADSLALRTPFTVLPRDSVLALESRARQQQAGGSSPSPLRRDLVELSRVGFSRDSSRAVVYLGHICGGLCGTGWKVQLRRDSKRVWRIVTAETVWIS